MMPIIAEMPDEIADDVWNVQVHGPGPEGRWFVQGPMLGDVPGENEIVPSAIVEDREAALSVAAALVGDANCGVVIYADPELKP